MRHLAAMRYLVETAPCRYGLTDFSRALTIPIIGDGYPCLYVTVENSACQREIVTFREMTNNLRDLGLAEAALRLIASPNMLLRMAIPSQCPPNMALSSTHTRRSWTSSLICKTTTRWACSSTTTWAGTAEGGRAGWTPASFRWRRG